VRLHAKALLFSALLLLLTAPSAGAVVAVDQFVGNPSTAGGATGGLFATSGLGSVAVNATGAGGGGAGDVYLSDGNNRRIQRFDALGNFISTWGKDVVVGGGTGPEICTVAVNCKGGPIGFGQLGGEITTSANLAVNQASGNVYAAEAFRVQVFSPTGAFIRAFGKNVVQPGKPEDKPAASAQQTLTVKATAGSFTLEFRGQKTADLAFDVPASGGVGATASVENALRALPAIGNGNVTVSGGPGDEGGTTPYVITFAGALKEAPMPDIVAADGVTPLSGGDATASIVETTTGSTGFEVCTTAANCKVGEGTVATPGFSETAFSPALAPAGTANAGNVLVPGLGRIQEFTPSGAFVRVLGKDVVSVGPGDSTANEQQSLTVKATGGTFTLTFAGQTATAIPFDATPAELEAKLNALSSIGGVGASVTVSGGSGDATGTSPYFVSFEGALGGDDVAQMTSNGAGLTGGSPSSAAAVATTAPGGAFEECKAASFDICKGAASSAEVGAFSEGVSRVAEDSTGAIYVLESGNPRRVQKLTPQAGSPAYSAALFAPDLLSTTGTATAATNLVVDPTDDHVYVTKEFPKETGTPEAEKAESRILELDSGGNLLATLMANAGGIKAQGLGIGADGKELFVTNNTLTGTSPLFSGYFVLRDVTPPTPVVTEATELGANTATLNGTVNPNGGTQHTAYRFEYSKDGVKWERAPKKDADPFAPPTDIDVGNGTAEVAVSRSVEGLEADTEYRVRIVATKKYLDPVISPLGSFKTPPNPPTVKTGKAFWNGPREVAFTATVNPNKSPTTYRFEYGPDTSYGQSAPLLDAFAGDEGKTLTIKRQAFDLDTGTAYHYRIVATSAGGTSFGADRTIAPHDESRVYELVSAGDSAGLEILWGRGAPEINTAAERASYIAQNIGNPPGLPGLLSAQVAERRPDGWLTTSMIADFEHSVEGRGLNLIAETGLSTDLSKALVYGSTVRDAAAGQPSWTIANLDGSLEHLPPIEALSMGPGATPRWAVAATAGQVSADLSHAIFNYYPKITLVPGEPLTEKSNLYDYDLASGEIELINRKPNGDPLGGTCGAVTGRGSGGQGPYPVAFDGSAVYFTARPTVPYSGECSALTEFFATTRLYKRVDGESTVEISASQCNRPVTPTPCSTADGNDLFEGASGDGERVFLSSPRQLTDSDTDATQDLYLYDASPPVGQPALVQASAGEATAGHPTVGSGAQFQGVATISADGSRAYFVAKGQLTAEASVGANNLYLYQRDEAHPAGRIEFVAALPIGELTLWSGGTDKRKQLHALPPTGFDAQGAPSFGDGRFLFFTTKAALSGEDADSAGDFYRYDSEDGEMACLSCAGDGNFPVQIEDGLNSQFQRVTFGNASGTSGSPRVATDDGAAAVFSTRESLVAADENEDPLDHEGNDVYEWRESAPGEGELSLVSSGGEFGGATETFTPLPNGSGGFFPSRDSISTATISADGRDVFFFTDDRLVSSDLDNDAGADLYTARRAGGIPQPPSPSEACFDGSVCRGETTSPPGAPQVGSQSFSGPGNPAVKTPGRARRCPKGKVRRRGRCVKAKKKQARKRKGAAKQRKAKKHHKARGSK
jgi:hypothetical protein